MKLSVVIPALNAAETLDATLASLGNGHEIIVVDGGSSDETAALASRLGARVLASPRGRGQQLSAGAKAASGEWLLFLHADTWLAEGWLAVVTRHARGAGPDQAAVFGFALDDGSWRARLLERLVALRVRVLRLPYGDQGLLIHRDLYGRLGGYRPLPLMEDVDLIRRIGRRHLMVLDAEAITSVRRWRQDGWLRRSLLNLGCLALFYCGTSPNRIARLYGR